MCYKSQHTTYLTFSASKEKMQECASERWADNLSLVSAMTLKSLELGRCEIRWHWGDFSGRRSETKGPLKPRGQGVTLLCHPAQGHPTCGHVSGAGVKRVWWRGEYKWQMKFDQKYQCKEALAGFLCFLGCSVVERNQVCAENDSYPLLIWLWQLHNCISFFCLLQLLLQDGEEKKRQ